MAAGSKESEGEVRGRREIKTAKTGKAVGQRKPRREIEEGARKEE